MVVATRLERVITLVPLGRLALTGDLEGQVQQIVNKQCSFIKFLKQIMYTQFFLLTYTPYNCYETIIKQAIHNKNVLLTLTCSHTKPPCQCVS